MPLTAGESAPWFKAPTASTDEFALDTAAGRYVLLAFLPLDDAARGGAIRALAGAYAMFDDVRLSALAVARDPQTAATARDMRGLRWVLDPDGAISRLYGALDREGAERPFWMVLDPTLRVMTTLPLEQAERMVAYLAALPAPAAHAGTPVHAPVLIAPRIFEPELCADLIALHEGGDSALTGGLGTRRDVPVTDPGLQAAIRERLARRLFPQIKRALGFQATEVERFMVSCSTATDGAVLPAHRPSATSAGAHRQFACSISLNADFDGGDLRFAEFGPQTYRPPPGGAAVFSCGLLHEVTQVTAGRRYAVLSFLYDDTGAQALAAHNRRVATPEPAG